MKTLLLTLFVMVATAGCGATITFQPVTDGYYSPPPPVVYYHRYYQYGRWIHHPGHYHGVLVCSRYQGCTWR